MLIFLVFSFFIYIAQLHTEFILLLPFKIIAVCKSRVMAKLVYYLG